MYVMNNRERIYADAARLHIDSINTGFLPSLGVRFLTLMYRCIDEAASSVLIVSYEGKQMKGFVSGTLGTESLYLAMLAHPIELFLSLLPVIFDISKLGRIISILRHMSGSDRAHFPSAELLTICVRKEHRRAGEAESLYQQLSNYFAKESVSQFVVIVGKSLTANAFYKKQGARVEGSIEVHAGTDSNVYIQGVCICKD